MIACAKVTKREIRRHYDLATPFYRLLWGPHIHHGLWHGLETCPTCRRPAAPGPATAHRPPGRRGVGLALARTCWTSAAAWAAAPSSWPSATAVASTGLTLSPVQRTWAPGLGGVAGRGRADALPVRRRRAGQPFPTLASTWSGTSSAASTSSTSRPSSAGGRLAAAGRPRRPVRLAGRRRSRPRRLGRRRLRELSLPLARHGRTTTAAGSQPPAWGAHLRRPVGRRCRTPGRSVWTAFGAAGSAGSRRWPAGR